MFLKKGEQRLSKPYIAFVIVLLVLVGLFLFNIIKSNHDADYSDTLVRGNLSLITKYDFSSVQTVEAQVKVLQDSEAAGNFDVNKNLEKNQYRQVFNTSIVIGDSITEGLEAYGYLSSSQVFSGIGASVMHGDKIFTSAAKTYPGFAFFSFGMNDMGNYTGHADMFVQKYEKLIKEFQATSPDTKIYINGISKPSENAIKNNPILSNYQKFNAALKDMCKKLDIKYIDNVYILEEHPEYYAGDGIHVTSEYYVMWLNNMILKAGL